MGSILSSGGGLDGVLMPGGGAFVKLGTINAGQCAANSSNSKIEEAVANKIFQDSETDLEQMMLAASGAARQTLAIPSFTLTAPTEYRVGDEVSLGDRNAADKGDLNNITKMGEVIATGYTQLRDGRWVTPTGAILNYLPNTAGTGISLGSDNTSGTIHSYYVNDGSTSITEINVS